jgi:hypothetical protein
MIGVQCVYFWRGGVAIHTETGPRCGKYLDMTEVGF